MYAIIGLEVNPMTYTELLWSIKQCRFVRNLFLSLGKLLVGIFFKGKLKFWENGVTFDIPHVYL